MAAAEKNGARATDGNDLLAAVKAGGVIPRHVAVIMDGNGRWAKLRRLPRVAGHRAGRHAVRRTLRACGELGVEYLTLYTFSQENWKRPAAEVGALWHFLEEVLASERAELRENDVRLVVSGETGTLPDRVRAVLDETVAELSDNDGLVLNLALAYGGRTEILRAARRLAERVAGGGLRPEDIDEAALRSEFYAPSIPDPDLVIRTSGEYRLSNFLIWQVAYAEIHFTPVLWPDFGARDLLLAVQDFQGRERRYGDVGGIAADDEGEQGGSLFDPARWKRLLGRRT